MSAIELRPTVGGKPIISAGDASLLYLVGQNGSFHWVDRIDNDMLPVLVATPSQGGVSFAPLHPMCHLGADVGRVVQVKSGDVIHVGVTAMSVHLQKLPFLKRIQRRSLWVVMLAILIFMTGWCLRGLVYSDSSVASQSQEEPYVF
ncbi:MAG: hypothetical protein COV45_06990 [Deltaproteobacteria bacterium CG11_big_fil_rev_8_21_14_0_20_47_16]|nr:MAG: hypothetical protein COV45_06990 [Deltaproteobacteria bacterium CG11_big_fil_rev_8_21_14_0_20_47_16]